MSEKEALFEYCLRLGDTSLILGHRLSEWCGHGPVLEEDIALTNLSLDLVGQARTLLAYAGEVEGKGRDEDQLAYLRIDREYRNLLLAEQPNGHFGTTIARQFLFSVFYQLFLEKLQQSKDETLAGFAAKSVKEINYHVRHSSEWVLRLGDGTEESHERMKEAIEDMWQYTGEMFQTDEVDQVLIEAGIAPDAAALKDSWTRQINQVLETATLPAMPEDAWMDTGGKVGLHSEHLGFILTELQYLQRTYPGQEW